MAIPAMPGEVVCTRKVMNMLVQYEKKKIPILMYHSISEHACSRFKPFTVPPALFARHIAYLYQHSYTPLTVSQFIKARTESLESLPERPVVLTFDDGFTDFFTEALPILHHYGFTATLYVPTAYVNATSRWMESEGEGERRMVTWSQLMEISAQGIECGAHSHSHPQLDILPFAVARDEIVQSKRILEDHLGMEVTSFAYPHGYHTTAVQWMVKQAGYTSACAVKYALSMGDTNPFSLARLLVGPTTDEQALAALLNGRCLQVAKAACTRPLAPAWRFARYCSAVRRGVYQEGAQV